MKFVGNPFAVLDRREAILELNEMLRSDPRFREVRDQLRRCPICARRQCRDSARCREKLEEWAKYEWDTAVDRAVYRARNSVDDPGPTT